MSYTFLNSYTLQQLLRRIPEQLFELHHLVIFYFDAFLLQPLLHSVRSFEVLLACEHTTRLTTRCAGIAVKGCEAIKAQPTIRAEPFEPR